MFLADWLDLSPLAISLRLQHANLVLQVFDLQTLDAIIKILHMHTNGHCVERASALSSDSHIICYYRFNTVIVITSPALVAIHFLAVISCYSVI